MADREREKKKKRAYLDDFEKDLNGNYQYRGAHYRYAGEHPHSRVLALLWLFCGGGAALTVGAGALPGATAHAPVYLLLPYMAALVRRARAGLYPRTDRTKIALFVQGDSGTLRCCLCGAGGGCVCSGRTAALGNARCFYTF